MKVYWKDALAIEMLIMNNQKKIICKCLKASITQNIVLLICTNQCPVKSIKETVL